MKSLPHAPELLRVARRVVWFKEPEETLADPVLFLAHVMTYGTIEDLAALEGFVGKADYCEVLEHAPPGVFDKRSWAYWHLKCGREPAPHRPLRKGVQSQG
jgi:hypothetical protein